MSNYNKLFDKLWLIKKNIHFFILPLTPAIFIYINNSGEILAADAIKVFCELLAVLGILFIIISYIPARLSNSIYSFISTIIILLLSFGFFKIRFFDFIESGEYLSAAGVELLYKLFPEIWVLGSLLISILVIKVDKLKIRSFLNAVSVAIIILFSYNLAINRISVNVNLPDNKNAPAPNLNAFIYETKAADNKNHKISRSTYPDIYLIVLDAYARNDMLERVFGYSNRAFSEILKAEGFQIASKSRSNYNCTTLSIYSLFMMGYNENWPASYLLNAGGCEHIGEKISNSFAISFLKERGYKFIAFSPYLISAKEFYGADIIFDAGIELQMNQFELAIYTTSIFGDLFSLTGIYRKQYKKIINQLNTLENLHPQKITNSPFILYAHIDCPHPPFVVNKNGEYNDFSGHTMLDGDLIINKTITQAEYIKMYSNAVEFLNGRIISIVKNIKLRSAVCGRKAVILIMGDHGSRGAMQYIGNTRQENPLYMAEKFAPFIAGYGDNLFADARAVKSFETISHINIFRFVFNSIFNVNYPMLDNESRYFLSDALNGDFSRYVKIEF